MSFLPGDTSSFGHILTNPYLASTGIVPSPLGPGTFPSTGHGPASLIGSYLAPNPLGMDLGGASDGQRWGMSPIDTGMDKWLGIGRNWG